MGYQWACADGGAAACKGKIKATDEEDLRKQLLQHVKKKHGLANPTATIVDHLVAVAKKT